MKAWILMMTLGLSALTTAALASIKCSGDAIVNQSPITMKVKSSSSTEQSLEASIGGITWQIRLFTLGAQGNQITVNRWDDNEAGKDVTITSTVPLPTAGQAYEFSYSANGESIHLSCLK